MIFPKSTQRSKSLPSRVGILETFVNLILFTSQFGIIPIILVIIPYFTQLGESMKHNWLLSGQRGMTRFRVIYSWEDGRICSFFFKEAGCMQVQVWVLIVDPFTKYNSNKGLLWEHGAGATASHLIANRRQRAVSGHSAQEQVLIKCLIISLI